MAKLYVGIDFGTSTTVVRYKLEGTDMVVPIKDADGKSDIIPSVIFKMPNGGNNLYGQEALTAMGSGMDGELISNFKMGLLSPNEIERKRSHAYIEEFMRYVYSLFAAQTSGLNYSDMEVHISYPAKWTDSFVNFMKQAVISAGFGSNVHGMNEPTAATYNMLYRTLPNLKRDGQKLMGKPLHVFMLDMGAGTTDIVIFQLNILGNGQISCSNILSYPSIDNPCLCGGREIDKMMANYVLSHIRKETNMTFDPDFFTVSDAKFWKDQTLSPQLKKDQPLPLPSSLANALRYLPNGKTAIQTFKMSRQEFEKVTFDHWHNLYNLISSAMNLYRQKYGVDDKDIDLLYLTGGHSQWYLVQDLFLNQGIGAEIAGKTPKPLDFALLKQDAWRLVSDALPHEAVASGLCLINEPWSIASSSANNIWIEVRVGDKKFPITQIAKIGQQLPIKTKISPRFVFHTQGWEEILFNIEISLYSGHDLAHAQRTTMTQLLNNDSGRWFVNILFVGLPLLFGFDTTIEVPMELTVNEENTVDVNGKFLYANGENIPTDKLDVLTDESGKVVTISREKMK